MPIFSLICLLFFALYWVLIGYYRRTWTAMPLYTAEEGPVLQTRISVLVPARNEEKNIIHCLDSLSGQTYPPSLYEVIVIDDHSTDATWDLLNSAYYPDLSFMCLKLADEGDLAGKAHKKQAIETGIRASGGDLIVTTDADCQFDPDWLRTIASFYETTGAKFIAAPVRIGTEKHPVRSFLQIFQTLDFITLQGITAAAVYRRIHSMCNGANLAYERKTFYEVEGFKGIDSIPSGDDMLLMHKIYLKYPDKVFYLKNRRAIVSTEPLQTFNGFVNQRIRWASKADKYDDKRIFGVLLLVYLINLLFLGLLLASGWNIGYLWLFLVLLLVKTLVEYPFVRSVAQFFGQQRLMVYFPLLQPFHILYTIVIGWLGKFGSYRWKERKINR